MVWKYASRLFGPVYKDGSLFAPHVGIVRDIEQRLGYISDKRGAKTDKTSDGIQVTIKMIGSVSDQGLDEPVTSPSHECKCIGERELHSFGMCRSWSSQEFHSLGCVKARPLKSSTVWDVSKLGLSRVPL
jgi:hypothetical protein